MKKVKAKFRCFHIEDFPQSENKNVSFEVVTDDGCEENKTFSKFTPAGQLGLTVSYDTPASDFFEVGKEYYLDISEAE